MVYIKRIIALGVDCIMHIYNRQSVECYLYKANVVTITGSLIMSLYRLANVTKIMIIYTKANSIKKT